MNKKQAAHKTKDGQLIPIAEMSDSHLTNTINFYRRKAKDGITVFFTGGYDSEDFFCHTDVLEGRRAEEYLNLDAYLAEAYKRKLPVWQGV